MSIFKDKVLLITGGTGSFGNTVLNRFLDSDIGEIRIFSRDEKKQDDMRRKYQNDKIQFHIGDVRDFRSVKNAMYGVDYIFHAAALKQVPSCEFFPLEAVKTNVLGTDNVLTAAIESGVKKVYKESPLSYVEKGQELSLDSDDSFYLIFKPSNGKNSSNIEQNVVNQE